MRALRGGVSGCWPFREVACHVSVATAKEETTRMQLDSGISLIPVSPASLFLYLMLVGETGA